MHLFYEYVQDWPNGTGLLISVYGCRVEIPKEGILFDPVEVNDVRVVPFSVFLGYVLDHNSEAFGKELTKMEAML